MNITATNLISITELVKMTENPRCQLCDAELDEEDTYCQYCGTSVFLSEFEAQKEPEQVEDDEWLTQEEQSLVSVLKAKQRRKATAIC